MMHGHIFDHKECLMFMDQYLQGAAALPKVTKVSVTGGRLTAEVESQTRLLAAQLCYTTGPHHENSKREWIARPLAIEGRRLRGEAPPAEATAWFVTVSDERDAMVSSEPDVK